MNLATRQVSSGHVAGFAAVAALAGAFAIFFAQAPQPSPAPVTSAAAPKPAHLTAVSATPVTSMPTEFPGVSIALADGRDEITTLQGSGKFAAAAEFAAASAPALRRDLLNAAYYEWARREPELAVQMALRLGDAGEREYAVESALSGWARTDPAALAEAAMAFPEGGEKTAALTKAFRAWLVIDPTKAGEWIAAHPAQLAVAESVFHQENR
jgi:hypothetical protein